MERFYDVLMTFLFIIVVILLIMLFCYTDKLHIKMTEEYKKSLENAYFEGQVDCLREDIRITKEGNCYIWIKSPWNEVDFNPNDKLCK